MEVLDISTSERGGIAMARARLRPHDGGEPLELWYRFEGLEEPLDGMNEAVAAAMIVPCMLENEPLSLPGPLSPVFIANCVEAQRGLAGWYDDLQPITVKGPLGDAGTASPASGVIGCFSGGVDSWYSLLKHEARVTHLLLVRGFDVGLGNDILWRAARDSAAGVAGRLGKKLVTCETNLRDVADKRRSGWGKKYAGDFWGTRLHGAALASVALPLRRTIGELIVPATHSLAQIKPWGSSPQLDPLWSDGYIEITHDGCEADRVAKVRRLADSDVALATLRVCHADTSAINCGHCEKCIRTMLALRLCGALDRARTFPHPLPLSAVHALVVPPHQRHHYVALRDEARRIGDKEVLAAAEILLGDRLSAIQTTARLRQALRPTVVGHVVRMVKKMCGATKLAGGAPS
ncbi:MAG: hypothetical protein RBS99_11165 [Rhodospirillales bacterium]|jgi:hypothetical protein|nr:hypothetical protein [Rhodospirillales bacterium]